MSTGSHRLRAGIRCTALYSYSKIYLERIQYKQNLTKNPFNSESNLFSSDSDTVPDKTSLTFHSGALIQKVRSQSESRLQTKDTFKHD